MPIPSSLLPTTCDVYRPFGAASPTESDVPCRLRPVIGSGRSIGGSNLIWTHTLDVQESVDIRDAVTRFAGSNSLAYGDGDEIRVPGGGSSRFVVVWVEIHNSGTANAFKRVYLMRHTA